jgi:hypothetical protein
MKTMKINKVERLIKEGIIECLTDLKIGYVEIRWCKKDSRETIYVIKLMM